MNAPVEESAARQSAGRRRSVARLLAVQALYQIEINRIAPTDPGIEGVVGEFVRDRLGKEIEGENYGEADRKLFVDIVRGVSARQAEIDPAISSALSAEWPIQRLETILRAILRAGTYELLARTDIPPRVIINEYVDIAHAFFAGKESGLVNGVLDRLARGLRAGEAGCEPGGAAPAG
jgi:N utilization substance protein B